MLPGWLSRSASLAATGLYCCSCTTTLDPTTLDTSEAGTDPEPEPEPEPEPGPDLEPEPGCYQGEGGSTFANCADLPACSLLGEDGSHLICEHRLSYDAASHECRLRGGHLVEIDSAEENQLIAETVEATVGTNVWLGGRRSEAFVWAWERSQIVFWRGEEAGMPEDGVFVTWQPMEPNNSSTVSDEPEKCLAFTLGDADWNDRACSLELAFVCEAN